MPVFVKKPMSWSLSFVEFDGTDATASASIEVLQPGGVVIPENPEPGQSYEHWQFNPENGRLERHLFVWTMPEGNGLEDPSMGSWQENYQWEPMQYIEAPRIFAVDDSNGQVLMSIPNMDEFYKYYQPYEDIYVTPTP